MRVAANKHLLLWSSVATLALLGFAAFRENVFQEWREIQRAYRAHLPESAAKDFRVQLRQIVSPSTGATDRCVTCHVGMAPGEPAIAGHKLFDAHPNVVHDPADLGCVVCHSGQGRATEKAAAHGDVRHWPEPMIPARFADSGCGSCHTHLAVPRLDALTSGGALVERHDCLACHALDGRGGTLRPGGAAGMTAPDLSRAGMKRYDAQWYETHLERAMKARSESASAGPVRPASESVSAVPVRPASVGSVAGENADAAAWRASFGAIAPDDRAAIDAFLSSRVGAPNLVEGKALFHSLGCRGCHKVAGVGGNDGPDLTLIGERDPGQLGFSHVHGERTLANWLAEHFRAPARVVPGSLMPELALTDDQIESLTGYMLSLRRAHTRDLSWPDDRIRAERFGEREFATDGATLYGSFCAACHGPRGDGSRFAGSPAFPAIGNPDFLAIASDSFLTQTIRRGRPGRRMPAWGEAEGGLRPEEIERVVAFVRSFGNAATTDTSASRWARDGDSQGAARYASSCASCHGERGEGKEGPALHNRVLLASASDTYLYETIRRGRRGTAMPSFETGSTTSKALSPSEIESIVAFMREWEVTTP
jgi:mono/diheme cytochrome c family protein